MKFYKVYKVIRYYTYENNLVVKMYIYALLDTRDQPTFSRAKRFLRDFSFLDILFIRHYIYKNNLIVKIYISALLDTLSNQQIFLK